MKCSKAGHFYGNTNETLYLNGIILNDANYLHDRVDWHFHENAYFTFLLEGFVQEGNKRGVNDCSAGSLLFHNWQDAHYNIGSKKFTRGFHVEIYPSWFSSFDIDTHITEGSINIQDPSIKRLMYTIFKESKSGGSSRQLAIDALLIELFQSISRSGKAAAKRRPTWVKKIEDALHDDSASWGLTDLAKIADIHPVHLSRDFSKYFHTTLGDYIRQLKVQQALSLMPNKDLSLTEISAQCNFSDQSHFIRTFKSYQHMTPLSYRKLLLKKQ